MKYFCSKIIILIIHVFSTGLPLSFGHAIECNDGSSIDVDTPEIIDGQIPFVSMLAGQKYNFVRIFSQFNREDWLGTWENLDQSDPDYIVFGEYVVQYVLKGKDARKSVMKIEGSPKILKISNYQNAELMILGNILTECMGGAKVLEFGRLVERAEGKDYAFIVLEQLFPGELSFNIKSNKNNPALMKILQGNEMTRAMIAEIIFKATTNRIAYWDPDILISHSGEVFFLDGEFWKIYVENDYERFERRFRRLLAFTWFSGETVTKDILNKLKHLTKVHSSSSTDTELMHRLLQNTDLNTIRLEAIAIPF